MLIVKSPLRISLGGGGTDIPSYFKNHSSFFISAAIDKYVYISINKVPEPHYFIRYSKNETEETVDKIDHNLVRELLKIYNIKPGIEITSFADLPTGTGLGSSGSFLTALVKALDIFTGTEHDKIEVAKIASRVEIDILKEPVGYQDTLISSVGGLTSFEISNELKISYNSNFVDNKIKEELFRSIYLIDTGKRRSASKEIENTIHKKINNEKLIQNLNNIKDVGYQTKKILQKGELDELGRLLTQQWKLKFERSPSTFHKKINLIIEELNNTGALGAKLIGAGGGGYIMALVSKNKVNAVKKYLNTKNLSLISINVDNLGAREY